MTTLCSVGIPMQVIMRGDDSVMNFLENLKKGKTTMYHATGMLIGCGGSGKTTLLERLKDIDLDDILNNTRSTRGIDIQTDVFDVSDTIKVNTSDQKQRIKVRIDERSQNPRVSEPHEEISKKMKSLDIDDPQDIEEDATSEAADDEEMSRDSMNTQTESLKGDEVAAPLFEKTEENVEDTHTIAKNTESLRILRVSKQVKGEPEKKISMVDFAGQCSYYSSHQIFLSPRAFFILVFNMEKELDEMVGEEVCSQEGSIYKGWTHREYVTFWAKNIHQYSSEKAPVLLVGTHAEEKTEEEKGKFFHEIWKTLETKDRSLQGHIDKKRIFAIGFHESEGIEKIKKSIVDVVQKLDHWGEMLPHSWAMFEKFFQEKKYLKIINKRTLMAFNEALPAEIKLERIEDINIMLLFFHDIREILHFNQKFLREVIILDIQWFADAFKNIITDKNHAKEDLFECASEWGKFNKTGELNDTLLSKIWEMNNKGYLEHKDEIMLYMEKLGLLAKMDDKKWYVPCMNKIPFPISVFTSYPASSILCFTFDVLPACIFHRLVATCMQDPSKMFSFEDRGCIYQTAVKLMYQDRHHNILIGMTQTEIQLQVFVVEGKVDVPKCHQIRERIEIVLHDLSKTFQENSEFHVAFKCKPSGFCDSRESAVLSESVFSRATFQCPSCEEEKIHTVNTRDITKYWKQIPVSTVSTPIASGGQDLEGRSRFAKLGMATNDVLNQAYRDILEMEVPPSDIESKAKATSVYKRLRPEQEHILLDAKHSGYKNFDISLTYTLIRNICSTIPKPTKGKWGDNNMPAAGEITVGDDSERIRLIRNSLTAHVSSASTPQKEFDDTWSMMSDVCQRLETFTGKKYLDSLKGIQKLALKEEGEDGIKAIIEKFAKDQHEQHQLLKTVVSDVQELKSDMHHFRDKYWKREQQQENLDKDESPVDSLERRPTDKEIMTVSGQIGDHFPNRDCPWSRQRYNPTNKD